MIKAGSLVSLEQSCVPMNNTEESILLKIHAFVDLLERNLSFGSNGIWAIFISRNNKNTVEEVESLH